MKDGKKGGKEKETKEGEAGAAAAPAKEAKPAPPPVAPKVQLLKRLEEELVTLEKAAAAVDLVLVARVVRYASTLRKYIREDTLARLVGRALAPGPEREKLLALVAQIPADPAHVWPVVPAAAPGAPKTDGAAKDGDGDTVMDSAAAAAAAPAEVTGPVWAGLEGDELVGPAPLRAKPAPEVLFYLHLLTGLRLLDSKRVAEAHAVFSELVRQVPVLNRRTLDALAGRAYSFFALTSERLGRSADDQLPLLLQAHRTACLHHDEPSQTVLTNAVLRLLVRASRYAQADKFRLNTKLPESASPAQQARHLLYVGRIDAIQLHYSDAHENLSQSLRKGPQRGAVGFRQEVQKLLVVVQLLMGDVPERLLFRDADLRRSLQPYYKMTHAVYTGNLAAFREMMRAYQREFVRDSNYSLVVRLRQNVIKTGLRKICVSYSRISIADVVQKLRLESNDAAEFVIAKAIHDGVIDGVIDHQAGVLVSKDNTEVYHTQEPQQAFHRRVQFCIGIHNEAVKALRFPYALPANPVQNEGDLPEAEEGGMFMEGGDDL